jgi:hypothetical protein
MTLFVSTSKEIVCALMYIFSLEMFIVADDLHSILIAHKNISLYIVNMTLIVFVIIC